MESGSSVNRDLNDIAAELTPYLEGRDESSTLPEEMTFSDQDQAVVTQIIKAHDTLATPLKRNPIIYQAGNRELRLVHKVNNILGRQIESLESGDAYNTLPDIIDKQGIVTLVSLDSTSKTIDSLRFLVKATYSKLTILPFMVGHTKVTLSSEPIVENTQFYSFIKASLTFQAANPIGGISNPPKSVRGVPLNRSHGFAGREGVAATPETSVGVSSVVPIERATRGDLPLEPDDTPIQDNDNLRTATGSNTHRRAYGGRRITRKRRKSKQRASGGRRITRKRRARQSKKKKNTKSAVKSRRNNKAKKAARK
jgi:hypothetical protein